MIWYGMVPTEAASESCLFWRLEFAEPTNEMIRNDSQDQPVDMA